MRIGPSFRQSLFGPVHPTPCVSGPSNVKSRDAGCQTSMGAAFRLIVGPFLLTSAPIVGMLSLFVVHSPSCKSASAYCYHAFIEEACRFLFHQHSAHLNALWQQKTLKPQAGFEAMADPKCQGHRHATPAPVQALGMLTLSSCI